MKITRFLTKELTLNYSNRLEFADTHWDEWPCIIVHRRNVKNARNLSLCFGIYTEMNAILPAGQLLVPVRKNNSRMHLILSEFSHLFEQNGGKKKSLSK